MKKQLLRMSVVLLIAWGVSARANDDWGLKTTQMPSLDEVFSYSVPTNINLGYDALDASQSATYTAPPDKDYEEIQRDKRIYDPENQPNYNAFIGSESLVNDGSRSELFNPFLGEAKDVYSSHQNAFSQYNVEAETAGYGGSYFLDESAEAPVNVFVGR